MTRILSSKIGVDITATNPLYTDATLPTVGPQQNIDFVLGSTVVGADGTKWVFVQASGVIAQYDAVGIDENFQAAKLTKGMADDGFMFAIAQVAFADNDGGWVVCAGANVQCTVLASCAADVPLYTSATAGALDDDSSGTTKIDGIVAVVTNSGGGAGPVEVIMTSPKSTTF